MSCVQQTDLCRRRGDNYPFQFSVVDSANAAVDITGHTFRLVIDIAPDPVNDANEVLELAGVIVSAVNGQFEFRPSTVQMDITPNVYFYEVEMTDESGIVRTLVTGQLTIEQDIAK